MFSTSSPTYAGLGEGGRVGDRERHVEQPREGLREQRLARTSRAEQQDVGLGQLHAVAARALGARLDPLVVVIHRDGEGLLGLVLADHVRVEELVDLTRLGQLVPGGLGGLGELFLDDLVTEVDALVANVHAWPGDELLYLLLALSAERALQQVRAVTDACHPVSPLHGALPWTAMPGPSACPGLARRACPAMPSTACYLTVPPCGVRWINQTPSAAREGRGEPFPSLGNYRRDLL